MVSSGIWSCGDSDVAYPPFDEKVTRGPVAGNAFAIRREQFVLATELRNSQPDNQYGHNQPSSTRMSTSLNFASSIISSNSASLIAPTPTAQPAKAFEYEAKARVLLTTAERQPRPHGTIFPFGISSLSDYIDPRTALHLDSSSSDEEQRPWQSAHGGKQRMYPQHILDDSC